MGQAKLRGTLDDRKKAAKERNLKLLTDHLIDFSDPHMINLKKGYEFLRKAIHPKDWENRRNQIIEYLKERPNEYSAPNAKIRYKADEIGWYLFLCEEFFRCPLVTNPSQMSRIAPFIITIGSKAEILAGVLGIEEKLRLLAKKYKGDPDGLLFEILVGSYYLEQDFNVEFLVENAKIKTPDLCVSKGPEKFFVECKKLQRRTDYAEEERSEFLKHWEVFKEDLLDAFPDYWFSIEVKVELVKNPHFNFWEKFKKVLVLGDRLVYEDDEIKIYGEKRDLRTINQYLKNNHVKLESYVLSKLLGDKLVYPNCDRSHLLVMRRESITLASAPVLGTFVAEVSSLVGVTRVFSHPNSRNKKSREVKKNVEEALKQLSNYRPAIVHVMYEALEDGYTELLRWEKIEEKMLEVEKNLDPEICIKIHRVQYIEAEDKFFDVMETVKTWGRRLPVNDFTLIPNN